MGEMGRREMPVERLRGERTDRKRGRREKKVTRKENILRMKKLTKEKAEWESMRVRTFRVKERM